MLLKESYTSVDVAMKVPLYHLYKRQFVPPATRENPNGTVEEAIARAKTVYSAGNHYLKLLFAPSPHTNRMHHIGWFDTQAEGTGAWNPQSWRHLAKDSVFLNGLSRQIQESQLANPRLNVYFLYGFAPPGTAKSYQMYRALQSIYRGHMHFSEEITADLAPVRFLKHSVRQDAEKIVAFCDFAGAISKDTFSSRLADFGSPTAVYQSVGHLDNHPPLYPFERLFFGFRTLPEAMGQTIDLKESLDNAWDDHTFYVASHSSKVGEIHVSIKQSPVPQASIIFPSLDLRRRWRITDEFPVFVHPLGVIGSPNITAHGGAMLDLDVIPVESSTVPQDVWLRSMVGNNGNNGK